MVPVLSRSRDFSLFLDGTGPGTGKHWSREKVPVPKKLVPKKSTGPGTGKNWSRKKVPVPVPEKNSGYRHTLVGPLSKEEFQDQIIANRVAHGVRGTPYIYSEFHTHAFPLKIESIACINGNGADECQCASNVTGYCRRCCLSAGFCWVAL